MSYKNFGLQNTKQMFADALAGGYGVPAFNFYNMETLQAILNATQKTSSPVILAVSESALKYMSGELLMGLVGAAAKKTPIALHLDHGHSFENCKMAIDLGFSSVMIDGSHLPLSENIALTKSVVEYAKQFDVSVEGELGALAGIEDEDTQSEVSIYTKPSEVVEFVNASGVDSLAIAIGTSHGAYKRKSDGEELRFDILKEVEDKLPGFPLVLHGASTIPQYLVEEINKNGGDLGDARGIAVEQIRRAVSMNVCKINVDSDARLAFTAAIREITTNDPKCFDPRKFLTNARDKMTDVYEWEIINVMGSGK